MGEPHRTQKCRYTGIPPQPVSWYTVALSLVNCSDPLGMATFTEQAEPDCFWQWRQLHSATMTGSAAEMYFTAPQRQPPEILGMGAPGVSRLQLEPIPPYRATTDQVSPGTLGRSASCPRPCDLPVAGR
jgi:hypothetical protein